MGYSESQARMMQLKTETAIKNSRLSKPPQTPQVVFALSPAEKKTVEKRIRQSSRQPNKLEAGWLRMLQAKHPGVKFREQAIKFQLGNGVFYKPDHCGWLNGRLHCWECKGPSVMKGVAKGMMTVKIAAALWPEVVFTLVWRSQGDFKEQLVLP